MNNGILDSLGGIISTGKEAVIIYAKGGRLEQNHCFFYVWDRYLKNKCGPNLGFWF